MKSGVAYHLGPLGLQASTHQKARESEQIRKDIEAFGEHNIIRLKPGEMSDVVPDKPKKPGARKAFQSVRKGETSRLPDNELETVSLEEADRELAEASV